MLVQHRIKSSQGFVFFFFSKALYTASDQKVTYYKVQAKFPYIPFWITVTRKFNTLEQAEEYIKLIKDTKW